MTGDEPGLGALASRIADRSGMDLGVYKDRCLRRRIAVRMRACGVHTLPDYVALLDREPAEMERLLDALTINVTQFFRNPEAWAWLGKHVLPAMLEERQGQFRAWSAGCASGEEAYTLAMLLAGVLARMGRSGWRSRVRVDATDIDRRSLEQARAARYAPRAFAEAPPGTLAHYCRPAGPDELEILPEIRAMVEIATFDLSRGTPPPARYDLVSCRNVIIYFDREVQERLMQQFADALLPGGVLLLGKVESILGPARTRYELLDARERVYRKVA